MALTLKTLCGLSVEEIARAFLVSPPTMAQRLVRAKGKIRAARIPYEVPGSDRLAERLDGVLRVVYLVFNEGYAATSGDALVRRELCAEAHPPGPPAARRCCPRERGGGARSRLMLLQDSRRAARVDAARRARDARGAGPGALGPRPDRGGTGAGRGGAAPRRRGLLRPAGGDRRAARPGARGPTETDWPQIAALYALLLRLHPSPVVALNHAAAVAMGERLERGLRLIEQIEAAGSLSGYHLLPAAKADILRRLGRRAEAAVAYERALELVTQDAERRYLERRLREVEAAQ